MSKYSGNETFLCIRKKESTLKDFFLEQLVTEQRNFFPSVFYDVRFIKIIGYPQKQIGLVVSNRFYYNHIIVSSTFVANALKFCYYNNYCAAKRALLIYSISFY